MNQGQLGAWWLFVLVPTNVIFVGLNAEDPSNWGRNLIFLTFCDQSKECQGPHEAMTGSISLMRCCYCLVRQLLWGSKCSEGWALPCQLQLMWSLFLVYTAETARHSAQKCAAFTASFFKLTWWSRWMWQFHPWDLIWLLVGELHLLAGTAVALGRETTKAACRRPVFLNHWHLAVTGDDMHQQITWLEVHTSTLWSWAKFHGFSRTYKLCL